MKYYQVPCSLQSNSEGLYAWTPMFEYSEFGDINSEDKTCVISTNESLPYPIMSGIEYVGRMIK